MATQAVTDQVRTVVRPPSPREREVLAQLAIGRTNKETAQALEISEKTVEAHRANVARKLGVEGGVRLVLTAILRGFVPMPRLGPDGSIVAGKAGRAALLLLIIPTALLMVWA